MVAYFSAAPAADAAWAVFFLTGRRVKRLVPHASIGEWTLAATGLEEWMLGECYSVVGDGAETAALLLDALPVVQPFRAADTRPLTLSQWMEDRILPLRG